MKLEKRDLVEASLAGEKVWRAPVSAWIHLLPDEIDDETFAKAQIAYLQEYDWDWLKINSRATLFAEAFGNSYDLTDYDGVLARFISSEIGDVPDITKIQSVDISSGPLGSYLDRALKEVLKNINRVPAIQTVFSPLTVLAFVAGRPRVHTQVEGNRSHAAALRELINNYPGHVHAALKTITKTLGDFAETSIEMGCDGIFMAIMMLARDGIMTREEYEVFGKPYDLEIFRRAAKGKFNILHICGHQAHFDIAGELPANAISWGSINQGNPTMAEARGILDKVLVGGVDEWNTLVNGSPDDVIREAISTLRSCGRYKIFLSPGCCALLNTPKANLHALRQAVEKEIDYDY